MREEMGILVLGQMVPSPWDLWAVRSCTFFSPQNEPLPHQSPTSESALYKFIVMGPVRKSQPYKINICIFSFSFSFFLFFLELWGGVGFVFNGHTMQQLKPLSMHQLNEGLIILGLCYSPKSAKILAPSTINPYLPINTLELLWPSDLQLSDIACLYLRESGSNPPILLKRKKEIDIL